MALIDSLAMHSLDLDCQAMVGDCKLVKVQKELRVVQKHAFRAQHSALAIVKGARQCCIQLNGAKVQLGLVCHKAEKAWQKEAEAPDLRENDME